MKNNTFRNLTAFSAIMLFAASSYAAEYGISLKTKKGGQLRAAVVAKDLCKGVSGKPNSYKIIVHDENGRNSELYRSKSGREKWGFNCRFNQEVRHDLLEPNKIIELKIFNKKNQLAANKFLRIPCRNKILMDTKFTPVTPFSGIREVTRQNITSCAKDNGRSVVQERGETITDTDVYITPVPSLPQTDSYGQSDKVEQNCRLSLNVAESYRNSNLIELSSTCKDVRSYNLRVTLSDGEEKIASNHCSSSVVVNPFTRNQTLCQLELPNDKSIKIQAQLTPSLSLSTRADSYSKSLTVKKKPTYNTLPTVSLLSSTSESLKKENKAFGRGHYWQANINAQIEDQDLDLYSDGNLTAHLYIKREDGAWEKLMSKRAHAGYKKVSFSVEREYVEPLAFGKPYVDGSLKLGQNDLKIVVQDAFDGKNTVSSEIIKLYISN